MTEDRIELLEERHQQLSEKLASLEEGTQPKKDMWDKLTATTPLVTGLIMSGIGLYFAYTNNQAQLKLQETQTIEKFIPHLTGTEQEKKAAIIAMSSLADTETAAKFAELFPSEGTASALQSIATSRHTKDRDKVIATKALASTFNRLGDSYKATNDSSKAEGAYQNALSQQEKVFGKDSPELLDNLKQLAEQYISSKKYALAETVLKRCLTIQKVVYGQKSPQFIATIQQLSDLCKLDGKLDASQYLIEYANLLSQKNSASTPSPNEGTTRVLQETIVGSPGAGKTDDTTVDASALSGSESGAKDVQSVKSDPQETVEKKGGDAEENKSS